MTTWKAWALAAAIFVSGLAAGAFGMRAYLATHLHALLPPPGPGMELGMLERIDAAVGLGQAQKDAILPILREMVARMDAIHRENEPRMDALVAEMDGRIARLLDPAQQKRFEAFTARMAESRKRFPPPPPPPPPVP